MAAAGTLIVERARVLTAVAAHDDPLGVVDRGAVVCVHGRVAWVGAADDVDAAARAAGLDPARAPRLDAGGRLVTPGLVDCHTHLPFAGNRAHEFALRARGASYQEIAAAGGGIVSTVRATRAASIDELAALTAARADRALAAGTTTVEAKSGYDLTVDGEVAVLEAVAAAARAGAPRLVPTLLAHVVPPETRASDADRAAWVDAFATQLVPRVAAARLATSVDVYCDDGAFTLSETRTILAAARAAGLGARAHVGQFADLGGAALLAELGAWSADHLEQVDDAGAAALARAGVVAVMLPAACVQLRLPPPPVARLRAAGVALAVATDWNPGTAWCETLHVPMWLAATHYGMTVEETWLGVTRHAARALGRDDVGVLAPGAHADLVVWDTDAPADLPYRIGGVAARDVIVAGRAAARLT